MNAQPNLLAAAAALFALGANVLGAALLLMLNPHSRNLRWYAAFNALVIVWLAAQATLMLGVNVSWLARLHLPVVHMIPAAFLAFALSGVERPRRELLAVFAVGLVTIPFFDIGASALELVWQAIGWGGGAVLFTIAEAREAKRQTGPAKRSRRVLNAVLQIFVPIGVIGAIAVHGGFVLYVLPMITVLALVLMFVGIVHHQYYDVEVRAARTGELASGAAEQERLAILGELAASLAHEVRNPLTGMRSLTQQLAEEGIDLTRRQRYTGVILTEIDRLERIVSNLLEVSRRSPQPTAAGTTSLDMLFSDLELLVETRARRADLRLRARANDISAHAAREPLAQALLNLLLNAIAHSPTGGAVELYAERAPGAVRIIVRDEGIGVPVADRERIFEPFYSTTGTGLGLAVVRRIARELNWKVQVAGAEGRGAEFSILVPDAT
jgi:signal transduction histidine kinase